MKRNCRKSLHANLSLRVALATSFSAMLVLLCQESRGDSSNYQKYVIGERALGMGGAYTAAVDDPMAVYYNPGGMVFASSSMISASKSLFSAEYRLIEGGFIPSASGQAVAARALETENDLTLPSTLALMAQFGNRLYGKRGPERHAIGLSVLVPYQDSFSLRAKWKGGNSLVHQETFALSESERSVWTGGSYAYRVSRRLGLGLSVFLVDHVYRRSYDAARFTDNGKSSDCGLERCGYMVFNQSALGVDVVSLLFRLGALYAPSKNWRLGLTLTPPSIMLGDLWLISTKGSLDQTQGKANVQGANAAKQGFVEFYTDDYELKVARYEPPSIRAGVARVMKDVLTVDLDVAFHFPISYTRIRGDAVRDKRYPNGKGQPEDDEASPEWFDPGIVKRIERRPVVNLNLGGELLLGETWTIRSGIFSDFSSAPDVVRGRDPQLTKIHRVGGTLSLGFQHHHYDITLGVLGALGRGQASVYDPFGPQDEQRRPLDWKPADYQERSVYVFIAGIQKAFVLTAKELWEKAWDESEKRRSREDQLSE